MSNQMVTHYGIDFWFQPNNSLLTDVGYLKYIMETAFHICGQTSISLQEECHASAVSILYLLEKSHCSIHTSLETNTVCIDFFTFQFIDFSIAIDYLKDAFAPQIHCVQHFDRLNK